MTGEKRILTFLAIPWIMTLFLVVSTGASQAKTIQDNITFKGSLRNSLGGSCSTSTYNSVCPSGSCGCELYEGLSVSGNLIGKVSDPESNFATIHIDITVDAGTDAVGSPALGRCRPI